MQRKLKILGARGFTLIELLIVIGIIAVLTVAFLPTLRGGQAKARDAAKKALIEQLVNVIEVRLNEGGALPGDTNGVSPANPTAGQGVCATDFSTGAVKDLATLLGRVPQSFPAISGQNNLCTGGFFYNAIGSNEYILAIEVEEAASANVDAATTVDAITAVVTKTAYLELTDGAAKGTNGEYYYMIGKFN